MPFFFFTYVTFQTPAELFLKLLLGKWNVMKMCMFIGILVTAF